MPGERACKTSHMKPGLGIEMFHDRYEVHHGSGPVDSYSKDARRGMDFDVSCGKYTRYNYVHCCDWCVKEMSAPDEKMERSTSALLEQMGNFSGVLTQMERTLMSVAFR